MKEKYNAAFEGRWRFKFASATKGDEWKEIWCIDGKKVRLIDYVRYLCNDFYEAGFSLGTTAPLPSSVFTVSDGSAVTIQAPVSDGSPSESSFDEFWNLYDKRVGRAKCEKLWSKLTAKEKRDCIAYVPLYVQAQPDKQYRKNPETFLRNKSFYDEIINRDNKEQQRTQRFQQAARVIASYDCED